MTIELNEPMLELMGPRIIATIRPNESSVVNGIGAWAVIVGTKQTPTKKSATWIGALKGGLLMPTKDVGSIDVEFAVMRDGKRRYIGTIIKRKSCGSDWGEGVIYAKYMFLVFNSLLLCR